MPCRPSALKAPTPLPAPARPRPPYMPCTLRLPPLSRPGSRARADYRKPGTDEFSGQHERSFSVERELPAQPATDTGCTASSIRPPAPRPCESCPYRRDVPAGIWAEEEYDKLQRYDADTSEQPLGVFQCHQSDADSDSRRICAGWAGCHDGEHLLAMRLAVLQGNVESATYEAVADYTSPVPLFSSGGEAAEHGRTGLAAPDGAARHMIDKISRTRHDLQ
ncbi:DUF6283 family protein [Streptomyces sp. NPDC056254]|uniref:DUF6283 family protein n=1 Tax=Streptomyces sp. NPDC056254 TaxID=3345763 RepID=UPI0035D58282